MVDPSLVHLFLDTPLYNMKEKAPVQTIAEPVADSVAEPIAMTMVDVGPQAKVRPISKPLPELQGGALFLIQRERGSEGVEIAALEMIHKIGAAMKFAPEHIWIEAADFAEYELTESALLSASAKVVILMGHSLPVKEELGVPADFRVKHVGNLLLVSTPRPELLAPDRASRTALWQALKAALGL